MTGRNSLFLSLEKEQLKRPRCDKWKCKCLQHFVDYFARPCIKPSKICRSPFKPLYKFLSIRPGFVKTAASSDLGLANNRLQIIFRNALFSANHPDRLSLQNSATNDTYTITHAGIHTHAYIQTNTLTYIRIHHARAHMHTHVHNIQYANLDKSKRRCQFSLWVNGYARIRKNRL